MALYLGLTAEGQNDFATARTAYSSYIEYGRTSRVRHALESRLAALQRKQLEETARPEVRDEQRLAQVPGTPNVVAVLPLSFSGADTSLKPLERGMAELLTTDLARSSRLTVVERLRLQAVLDEIKLQATGGTDSSSNVRAGKILQAGRLVQGSILQQGPDLRVDAAVIDVPTTRVAGATNDNRALDQLLTLEKNIALGLFQQMGITLTHGGAECDRAASDAVAGGVRRVQSRTVAGGRGPVRVGRRVLSTSDASRSRLRRGAGQERGDAPDHRRAIS